MSYIHLFLQLVKVVNQVVELAELAVVAEHLQKAHWEHLFRVMIVLYLINST